MNEQGRLKGRPTSLGVSIMSDQTSYDATLDPRTGRPILPLDAENARQAEAESEPLTDKDNQGILIGNDDDDEDSGETDANNDMPHSAAATETTTPSSVDINSTVPRM